jgi:hypothetical protein
MNNDMPAGHFAQQENEVAPRADQKDPAAPETFFGTGNYSFMLLYIAFFMIPACWMLQLTTNKELPPDIAMGGAIFGATLILYGLYKIIRYGHQNNMVDTEAPGFGVFVAFTKFIDKLR